MLREPKTNVIEVLDVYKRRKVVKFPLGEEAMNKENYIVRW